MKKNGFTLIELSIVLIIIGFLAGVVVVGRTLIGSTRTQNIIKEYQTYQNAALMFRQTYKELPGDFTNAHQVFGIPRNGNGDDTVKCDGGVYEYLDFFAHLSKAGLIDDQITPIVDWQTPLEPGTTLAKTSVIDRGVWMIKHPLYIGVDGNGNGTTGMGWGPDMARDLVNDTPEDSFFTLSRFEAGSQTSHGVDATTMQSIDSKIDDKMPNTGMVRAGSWVVNWHTGQGYNAGCLPNSNPATPYDPGARFGCVLVIKLKKR